MYNNELKTNKVIIVLAVIMSLLLFYSIYAASVMVIASNYRDEASKEYEALNIEYEQIKKELSNLKSRYELVKDEYNTLSDKYVELESEYNTIKEEYNKLKDTSIQIDDDKNKSEDAQKSSNSANEIINVTAAEILKLAENNNFNGVPPYASTAEIYNKYNDKKVKISGKIMDIDSEGNLYLDCDNKGYNYVNADTTLVVYFKAGINSYNYNIGETVTVTGVAKCYTYAVIIS